MLIGDRPVYIKDPLGSVLGEISHNKISHQAYTAYGEAMSPTWTQVGTPAPEVGQSGIGYTGHYFDKESGLYYARNRYYDPSIGRFTERDLIDEYTPQGLNKYMYARNNPVNYWDPLGLYATYDFDYGDAVMGRYDPSFYQQYGYNDHWDFAQQNSQVYQDFGQMAEAMNNSFIYTDFFDSENSQYSYRQKHLEGSFEVAAANYKLWTQKSEDYQFGQHFQGNETQDISWWNDQYTQISSAHGKSRSEIDQDLVAFVGKTPTAENDVSPTEAYEYIQKDMQKKTIAIINENIRKRNLLRKIVSVNNDKGISISSEELESMKKYATLYDLQRILHKDSEPLSYHQNMVAKMAVLLKGIETTVVTVATLGLTTEAFVSEEIIAASVTEVKASGTALSKLFGSTVDDVVAAEPGGGKNIVLRDLASHSPFGELHGNLNFNSVDDYIKYLVA